MSDDDKRVQDCREQIRARVDNWAQGKGYGPGGWPKDAPVHDVIFLLNHIADLEAEVREKNAWEGRYNALLEKVEASRPREVNGDGSDLPFGTVVIDNVGDVWQRDGDGRWSPADIPSTAADYLGDAYAPYTIVYTPEENTNE